MATRRIDISLGPASALDSDVFQNLVGNEITAAASPSVGDILATVLADGGSDEGWKDRFEIPQEYVGTPKITIKGILDGAPGASDTLGFGFRKRAVADNESADGTFDAEQTVSATIGSSGSGHSDEDDFELSITLTAGDYAVADSVYFYFYIDASGTSYTGNVLITGVDFEFVDA
jgi:hypothetical protein